MTGEDMRYARGVLGDLWGLGRPLTLSEMGKALRLAGADPGASVRDYERGTTRVSGPVSVCIEMWLAGAFPPDPIDQIRMR